MKYAVILIAGWVALATSPALAQRYMMNSGYGWGTYRYWGPFGRSGAYYNPGEYRWGGLSPWVYRRRY